MDRAGLGLKFVNFFIFQNFFIALGVPVTIFLFRDADLLCSPR